MTVGVVLLVFGLVFLTGSALAAFAWAARTGQFENLERGAEVIFDADEPVGVPGDVTSGVNADREQTAGTKGAGA